MCFVNIFSGPDSLIYEFVVGKTPLNFNYSVISKTDLIDIQTPVVL